MAAGNTNFNLERLRGRENFDTWKRHAKSYLIIKGCWKTVDKGLAETPNEKQIEADERALAEISLMVQPCNFAHIAKATNAKEAWNALMEAYEDSGLTRKVELLKQLVGLKLQDCESMQDYVSQIIMTSIKVQNAGLKICDELTASLMLAFLPEEFRSLVLAVENSTSELTVDNVKTLLMQDAKFDKKAEGMALYTKKGPTNKVFRCHACKQIGHFAKSCPNKSKKYSKMPHSQNRKQDSFTALYAAMLTNNGESNDWFVDSGASMHMAKNDKDQFPISKSLLQIITKFL